MSEAIDFGAMVKALPAVTDATGRTVLIADSNGGLAKVSLTTLATAIAAVGNMMRTEMLARNTAIDADVLSSYNVIYTPSGDMNQWDANTPWLNMPTARPAGGFTLWCIREGSWKRQFYHQYMDSVVYMRYNYYSGTATPIWSQWRKLTSEIIA